MPGPHAFGSPTWDSFHPMPTTLGWNATAPRSYYNGRRLNASDGQKTAGPLRFFSEGCDAPAILPRGADGYTPLECLPALGGKAVSGLSMPVMSAHGGKLVAGSISTPGPTPGIPCGLCSVSITPATIKLTVTGFTGAGLTANGTWLVPQVLACVWQLINGAGVVFTVQRVPANFWQVQIAGAFPTTFNGTTPINSCIVPFHPFPGAGFPGAPVVQMDFV